MIVIQGGAKTKKENVKTARLKHGDATRYSNEIQTDATGRDQVERRQVALNHPLCAPCGTKTVHFESIFKFDKIISPTTRWF